MDIYNYLKKDHRKVKELMEQVSASDGPKQRAIIYKTVREELTVHAETEEDTFYKAIAAKGGKQLQEKEEHAEEEHDEIRRFIRELDRTKPTDDAWLVAFGELKYAVEHHVKEEEEDIFEKARKVLSDSEAEKLAEEMDALKQKKHLKKAA